MGAWDTGIRDNDYTLDVQGAFENHLKAKKTVAEASKLVLTEHQDDLTDPDDGPLFWLALLDMQWTYGAVDVNALATAKHNFAADAGMALWLESSAELYAERKQIIAEFLLKVSTPNPKPKKPPKVTIRKPKFKPGDCLAVQLEDGRYAAAYIAATDHSEIEYGKDLTVTLDYLSDSPPTLDIFERRTWLNVNHHNYDNHLDAVWHQHFGFRKTKARLQLIGNIPPLSSDPKESNRYGDWQDVCLQVVYQRDWDAENK